MRDPRSDWRRHLVIAVMALAGLAALAGLLDPRTATVQALEHAVPPASTPAPPT